MDQKNQTLFVVLTLVVVPILLNDFVHICAKMDSSVELTQIVEVIDVFET